MTEHHQNPRSAAIARWLLDHPLWVALLLLAHVAFAAYTVPRLKVVSGTGPFFEKTSTLAHEIEQIEEHFVSEDVVFIGIQSDDPFSHASLSTTRALGEKILQINTLTDAGVTVIEDVTSLATVDDVIGTDQSFRSDPLVPEEIPTDAAALAAIRTRALRNRMIRENLLSEQTPTVSGMSVRLVRKLDDDQKSSTVQLIRQLVHETLGENGHVTGTPAVDTDVAAYTTADLERFVPLVYGTITLLLYLFARRISAVLAVLGNISLCFAVAMGVLHVTGGSLNSLSTILPPVVLVIAGATMIHFFSEYAKHARDLKGQPNSDRRAMEETIAELLGPVFMTELTTAVGFATLAVSNVPAMREFGWAAAVATMSAMWLSFLWISFLGSVLPAGALLSEKNAALSPSFDRGLGWLADIVIHHAWKAVGASIALIGLSLWGTSLVRSDDNTIEDFGEQTPIRRATAFVEKHLGGSTQLVLSIKARDAGAFRKPEYLKRLDQLETYLRNAGADHVTTPADFISLMHRGFMNENDEYDRVPDNSEQVAQLLLMNTDDTLAEHLDASEQWARVVASFREHSSAKLGPVYEALDVELARLFPASEGFETHASGHQRQWVTMVDSNVSNMTSSFALSLLLVFGPILLAFRSVRAAAFTLPSNLFPILTTFGIMGLFGIPLSTTTATVSSIILGIAVDDTIHFIQYARLRIAEHGDTPRAVRETFDTKGIGAIWITIVISLGFFVTAFSNFRQTSEFGLLCGVAMVSGIFGELLLLPPLLVLTNTKLGMKVPPASAQ